MNALNITIDSVLNPTVKRTETDEEIIVDISLDPVTSEILNNLIEDNERLSAENEFLKNRKELSEFCEDNLRGLTDDILEENKDLRGLTDRLVKENKDLLTENTNLRKIIKDLKEEMQKVKFDLHLTKKERDELSRSWANSVKMCSYYRDLYFTAAEEEEDHE